MKAYKFRIYPNQEQKEFLAKNFGCVRFLWNQWLSDRIKAYEKGEKSKDRSEKDFKEEFEWLKEVDSISLQQKRLDLIEAYNHFFNRVSQGKKPGFPKFKRKNSKQSYRTHGIKIDTKQKKVKLPKLDWLKYRDDRIPIGKIRSATISKTPTGKYYVSLLTKEVPKQLEQNDSVIGIDLGLKDFVTLSSGDKISAPNFYRKSEKKLAKANQKLSRREKGSNNRNKARLQLAKIYEKIRNQRTDFQQKLSSKLINENQVVVVEDLNISGMLKNRNLSKSISDAGWYSFIQMLKYKAEWRGRQIETVDRFFPSSKTCSECKSVNSELKLSDREWVCQSCGVLHDRDLNASLNLKNTVGTTEINAFGDMICQ